jgi:hypothetical protein
MVALSDRLPADKLCIDPRVETLGYVFQRLRGMAWQALDTYKSTWTYGEVGPFAVSEIAPFATSETKSIFSLVMGATSVINRRW